MANLLTEEGALPLFISLRHLEYLSLCNFRPHLENNQLKASTWRRLKDALMGKQKLILSLWKFNKFTALIKLFQIKKHV